MTAPPERRRVHALTEAERNAIWECVGPAWYGTFYAWFPSAGGWHYSTRDNPAWRLTSAGERTVDARTIKSDPAASVLSFQFDELARLDPHAVLFTANGDAVPIPPAMLITAIEAGR